MSRRIPGRPSPLSPLDTNRPNHGHKHQDEARIALTYIQRVRSELSKDDPDHEHLRHTMKLIRSKSSSTEQQSLSPAQELDVGLRGIGPIASRPPSSGASHQRDHDNASESPEGIDRGNDTDSEEDNRVSYSRVVKVKSRKGIDEQKQTLRAFNRVLQKLLEAYDICLERPRRGGQATQDLWKRLTEAVESCRITRCGVQRFREKGKGSRWHMESGFAINLPFVYFEAEVQPLVPTFDQRGLGYEGLHDQFRLLKTYLHHALQYHSNQSDAGVLKDSERVDWIEANGWTGKLPKWIHREI